MTISGAAVLRAKNAATALALTTIQIRAVAACARAAATTDAAAGSIVGERQNPRRDSARPQSRGERAVFAARTSQQNGARIDPRREPRAQLRREPRADDLRGLFAFDLRFDEAAARRRVKSENPRALVFESNARAQSGVAIRVHRGGQGAPDRRPPRGLRLVERARGGDDIGAVGGAFDREQPLPDSGRESLGIENLANVAAAPEPMQPGRGEQQSVAIAAPHFGDSAGDIAAHQNGAQPRMARGEQGAAARAGGADGRAGRQIRERQIAIRNHGVARIGGGQKSGERKTRRQNGADIFERMDGAIGAPGVDLGFEFFDEKVFAADIGERAIDDFVAAAFYADNFNPATRMRASPFGGDDIRLAAREFALARNNNNRFHRPAQSQPAATAIATAATSARAVVIRPRFLSAAISILSRSVFAPAGGGGADDGGQIVEQRQPIRKLAAHRAEGARGAVLFARPIFEEGLGGVPDIDLRIEFAPDAFDAEHRFLQQKQLRLDFQAEGARGAKHIEQKLAERNLAQRLGKNRLRKWREWRFRIRRSACRAASNRLARAFRRRGGSRD